MTVFENVHSYFWVSGAESTGENRATQKEGEPRRDKKKALVAPGRPWVLKEGRQKIRKKKRSLQKKRKKDEKRKKKAVGKGGAEGSAAHDAPVIPRERPHAPPPFFSPFTARSFLQLYVTDR
jgi:hypothetical protein